METEDKILHVQNIIKGIFTSVIGAGVICLAGYGWWIDHLSDWQAGIFAFIGCILFLTPDKIPSFVDQFVQTLLNKIR